MRILGWEQSLIILIIDKNVIVISQHQSSFSHYTLPSDLGFRLLGTPSANTPAPLLGQNRYPSNQIKLQGVKGPRLNKNTWARVRRRGQGAVVCPVQPEERPNSVAPLERQSYWAVDLSCAIPNILGGESQYLHLTLYGTLPEGLCKQWWYLLWCNCIMTSCFIQRQRWPNFLWMRPAKRLERFWTKPLWQIMYRFDAYRYISFVI